MVDVHHIATLSNKLEPNKMKGYKIAHTFI
jgi:hypothetical protein